jgi:hypothetical protein
MRGTSSWVGRLALVASLALISAASSVACGLTADFSGLQGGAHDAGPVGDVTVGPDAPPSEDGSNDVLAPDGSPAETGASDTGALDVTLPDASFCASYPTPVKFCDDFDEGQSTVGQGWSATDVYPGSTAQIDYTYYSPPASFLSSIDASSAPASARLQEDLPLSTPQVSIQFEALLPQLSGTNFEVCTLHQPVANGTTYGLFYKYQDGNLLVYVRSLADDGGEVDYVGTIGPPPSSWFHVQIDIEVSEVGTIVVKHDGAVVLNATGVDTSTPSRASMFVELGYYSDAPFTALAHFDNVVIDWQ